MARTQRFEFVMNAEEYEALEALSRHVDMPKAVVIRHAIKAAIRQMVSPFPVEPEAGALP